MLNPLMLFGLLGLSVPIVIHLIQRQRLRPQLLATLQFLDREDVSNAFAPVPRDLLQLLLRLLLLLLFIFLMARFTHLGRDPGPRTLVAILDNSMSAQRRVDGGEGLFEQQKEQLLELIDSMGAKDQFSLMLVGDRIVQETGFLRDKAELRALASGFGPSESGSRALYPAILRALEQVQSHTAVNRAVLVFTDDQRVGYASYLADSRVGELLTGSQTDLIFVGDPLPEGANVAVTSGAFLPARAYLGTSAKLTATVTNFAKSEQTVEATFLEGETAGEARRLTLAAGQSAQLDLVHMFQSPVDAACAAGLADDTLVADNQFRVPMRMRERRQILFVAAADGEEEEGYATYQGRALFRYAVNPGEELGTGAGTYIRLKRITPLRFQTGDAGLALCSTVVLYGVGELSEKSVNDLAAFVRNGGGLVIIPERQLGPRRFNERFAPLLGGLQLGGLHEPADPESIDTREVGLGAELYLPLLRGEWGEVKSIRFNTYFRLLGSGDAACALRATNGDWLTAVVTLGRGRVCVQMFSHSLADSSLPRTTAFVPMVQELIAYVSGDEAATTADLMRVGDVRYVGVPEFRNFEGPVQLVGPEERKIAASGDRSSIRVAGLRRAGHYELTHPARKSARKRWLCVNPVLSESDLTPLSEAELAGMFGRDRFHRVGFGDLDRHFARQQELFPVLLWLVFAAFGIEAVMGAWQAQRQETET